MWNIGGKWTRTGNFQFAFLNIQPERQTHPLSSLHQSPLINFSFSSLGLEILVEKLHGPHKIY